MTRPIRPSEVLGAKTSSVPEDVFEAFNELIIENWSGVVAIIRQEKIIERIKFKMPGVSRAQIFDRGWLDIEDAYRAEGWKVDYDRPAYNESYEASFRFARHPS